jgi:signal transduction histidine kinase
LVNISLDLDIRQPEKLSPVQTNHIWAIVNEALSNVVRHANARNVRISAHQLDGRLEVVVQDDGYGLPEAPSEGFGLRNMQERARLLGGQLMISGELGKGTRVLLDAPVKDES